MTTYYKSLSADGRSCNGGHSKWSLPTLQPDGTYKPGRWMRRIANIEPCRRGYHVFERKDILRWINQTLYECEIRGETIDHGDKTVAESCRLLRPVPGCNERTLRLFACRVAEDTLPLYEAEYPDDDRPRRAIETARTYTDGRATRAELAAAGSAADSAADSAAYYAARSAAYQYHSAADSACPLCSLPPQPAPQPHYAAYSAGRLRSPLRSPCSRLRSLPALLRADSVPTPQPAQNTPTGSGR